MRTRFIARIFVHLCRLAHELAAWLDDVTLAERLCNLDEACL